MTTYAILNNNDPERCLRFIRQYCKDWHEDNAGAIRNYFTKHTLEDRPYFKVHSVIDSPGVSAWLDIDDKFIDFENNPRRRAI